MNEFQLSDCCSVITDGDHAAPPKAMEGIPFITIRNFDGNNINFTNTMYVPEEYYDNLKSSRKAQKNDILYSVVGSFGIPILIKDNQKFVFQRHIALLRPNLNKVVPSYLFHLMRSSSFYALADVLAVGSAQRTISLSALRKVKITLPSLEIQAKIGEILSVYDELIELNQRRIAILEEMAMRTYREWFVHFRFPGHEACEFENGLPKGWKKESAKYMFDISIGKTPPRKECHWFSEGGTGIPWLSISDMKAGRFIFSSSEGLTENAIAKHNIVLVKEDTVLLSFKLTVGRVSIAAVPMCTNEAIAHFKTENQYLREYCYCYLKEFHFETLGSTSSIASSSLNSETIKKMPFVFPPVEVLELFNKSAQPLFDEIKVIEKSILKLQQMRDRFLPQLMSGQLEI